MPSSLTTPSRVIVFANTKRDVHAIGQYCWDEAFQVDTLSGDRMVLKRQIMQTPQARVVAERETTLLAKLHHPNIVEYKHSWVEISRLNELAPYVPCLFILMQFCNAGSLESRIWPHAGESVAERARRERRHELRPAFHSTGDRWRSLFVAFVRFILVGGRTEDRGRDSAGGVVLLATP